MSSLTNSFSAVSFQEKPNDSFLTWFLIFLFLEITDNKKEKKRKELKHRFMVEAQNRTSQIQKSREKRRLAMSL